MRNEEYGYVHTEQKKDYTQDGLYRPQATGDELKTVHTSLKEQRRQEAEQMPSSPSTPSTPSTPTKAKKIEDSDKDFSKGWGYPTQPGAQPQPITL